jgi:ketosteroid isomerase-like protein
MSQANVEVVQAAFAAYFRGDEPALLELAAPDVIVTQRPDQPDVRDYHGHDGLIQAMTEWVGAWDDYVIEMLRVRDIDDLVFVVIRQRGRGKASGVPIEGEATFVFRVRHGKVVRWQMFGSEQEALKAVGLAG